MADPSGYLPTPDFASEMDRVYGPGNWRQTGGWRSQERENQLRAQGAQTVAPGRLSDHSRGASDAPGARDVVWLGHTPQQAAERLRAAQAAGQIAGVGQLYPEGAAGGQGAHLHVGLQPGVQADPWNHVLRVGDAPQPGAGPAPAPAADPWGTVLKVGGAAPAADPWGTVLKPAAPPDDFWHQAGRAIASTVGGVAGGVGSVIAGVEDAAEAFRRDEVLADAAKVRSGEAARSGWSKAEQDQALADADTLRRTGGIDFHPRATATARGVAAAATAADASISPANRTPLESTLHGAGQFVPVLAAGAVSPTTGALTFGAQGYESTYQAARAKGADEATARRAAALSGGIQYGLGALPVSAASDALVEATGGAGLGAIVPRVLGSGVANAGLMAANQTAENVAAQQTYDPNRPTGAGVAEAAEQGALVGGGMHAVGAGLGLARGAVSRLRRPDAPSPPPAAPADDTTTSPSGPGAPPGGPSPPAAPAPGLDGLPEPLAASTYYAHTSQPPEPIPEVPTATVETGPPAGLPPEPLASAAAPVPKAPPPPPPASYEDARVAYGAPADLMPGAIADVEDLRGAAPRQHSLFAAIRAIGGIRTVARDGSRESDVQQILQGAKLQPGTVNNKTGLSPDAMRGALQERGWFGVYDPAAQAGSNPGDNINDLYEAMRRESAGQRVFHPEDITPQSLAYRAAMEQEQADAGIVASDSKAVAAAKLAAHRAQVNRALGPDTTELKARAAALGIEPAAGASYEELLGDVLEREAIQGEVPNGQHWAAAQRQVLDELSPEDHAWLSDAERGPRGEQDVAGAARASGRGAASQSRTPHEDTPFAEGATSDRLGPSPVPAGAELAHIDPRALADVYEAGWFPFGHRLAEAEGAIRAGQYLTVPVAEYDREVRGAPFAAHLVANTRFEGKPEPLRMQDGRLVGSPTETTRLGGQTVEQGLFPGAEASARQAAAAREGALRASTPQQGAGPLFEAPDRTGDMFAARPEPRAEARRPEPAKPEPAKPEPKRLEDAGEKIGGARKDRWAERGLRLSDLEGMSKGEEHQYVVKDQVWPKPDYAAQVAAGADPEAVALTKIIRDRLAAKPRNDTDQGRRDYIAMMGHVREVLEAVKTVEEAKAASNAIIYGKLDWPKTYGAAPKEMRDTLFSIFKGRRTQLGIEGADVRKARKMVEDGFPGAVEPWTRRFEVRQLPDGQFGLYKTGTYRALERLPSREAAAARGRELYEAQKAAGGEEGKLPERPHLDRITRTGPDVRDGKDVTGDDFVKDFGFRGVEFGNWVASDERQKSVNLAYDALHDLAGILHIPPEALSLGGRLGLAFGARGKGRAAAHYEPGKIVINLTKMSGAGSAAHEWAHGVDHYFGMLDRDTGTRGQTTGATGWYERVSDVDRHLANLRPEMREAFKGVLAAMFTRELPRAEAVREAELRLEEIEASIGRQQERLDKHQTGKTPKEQDAKFVKQSLAFLVQQERAKGLVQKRLAILRDEKAPYQGRKVASSYAKQAEALSGKSGAKGYWARPTEMFARAFESYVFDRLHEQQRESQYLVQGVEPDRYAVGYKGNPYPAGPERDAINAAFDHLVATIQTRPGEDGRPVMFQRAYHGSPHDFDRFSSDRIGTGEGAQAFGHGLYFAGHEAVAQGYRDRLANAHMEVRTRERSLRDDHGAPGIIGRDALRDFRGKLPEDVAQAGGKAAYEIDKVIGDALHLMRNARLRRVRDGSEALHGAVDALRATEPPYGFSPALREMTLDWLSRSGMDLIQHKAGKLYHVEIPEDHEFLDRDKPLHEQSPAVKKALEPLAEVWLTARRFGYSLPEMLKIQREEPGRYTKLRSQLGETTLPGFGIWKGSQFYDELAAEMAKDRPETPEGNGWNVARPTVDADPPAASRLLSEHGIPGLRYLDQFSRDSGQGSHNYVVFDDSRIETVAKFQRGGIRPAPPTPPEVLKEIADRYAAGDTYRQLMSDLKVSSNTINRALKLHGVERRPTIGEEAYRHPATHDEAVRDEALRLYRDEEMSADEVARRLGISQAVVSRIVKDADATRSPSERMALRSGKGHRTERGISAPWQSAKDGSWQFARSTYEMARMRQLDDDPDVERYTTRLKSVPMPDGSRYMPDIEVHYKDGRIEVEEIKPTWRRESPDVLAKEAAAQAHYAEQGKEYRVVGPRDIGRAAFEAVRDGDLGHIPADEQARIKKAINVTLGLPEMWEGPRLQHDAGAHPTADNDRYPPSRAEQLPDHPYVVFDARAKEGGIQGIFPTREAAEAFIDQHPGGGLDYGTPREIEHWNPTGPEDPRREALILRDRILEALRDHDIKADVERPDRRPLDPHEGMETLTADLHGVPLDPNGPHADIIRDVANVIRRLAPHAEVRPMARMTVDDVGGRQFNVYGAAYRENLKHVIAWSLESPDHVQTGRHEAVHVLKAVGAFTHNEWRALEGTAEAQGWIPRYRIDRNYSELGPGKQLEEAIAHRFQEWRADGKSGGVLPSIVRVIFQRMADALKQIGDAVRRAFGGEVTADEVFRRIESGEIGRRTGALQERRGAAFQRERDDKTLDELKSPPAVLDRLIGEGPDKLGRAIANGLGRIFSDDAKDIARNIHMGLNPMATGDVKAQDTIKAYLSTLRAIDWEHAKADKWLESRFPKDARDRMGLALDQHGVLVRRGVEPGEHGLDALTQAQRAAVEEFNRRQEVVFRLAGEEGIHDTEGLAFHFPRMGVRKGGGRIRNDTPRRRGVEGGKLSTTTGQMRQRKYETMAETEAALKRAYGDDTYISRDIRALNLGTRNLMRAWAGKRLVNTIKAIGKESMAELVSADPALKGDPEWFHIDHPAMTEWKVKLEKDPERPGKMKALLDEHGEPIFEPRPLYMPKSWEGPMKVALAKPDPAAWRAFMTLKSKAVGAIMYNPLVHNQVIFGKAFPTMVRHAGGDLKNPLTWPGGVLNVLTFKMYRDGYLVKTDDVLMNRALTVGNVVPITGHYVMMDLGAIEGERSLESGHGWTSQIVGAAAKMMNHAWEEPTRQAIDKFHDFVSNRMLWDQVANLQMGIWKATTDHYQHMGYPQDVADKLAGDAANLYAGAVPREALSGLARGILNGVLFSRSFHQTNLGGVKRAIMGLPSDVRAQITVAHGPEMAAKASGAMRAQMASTIMIDLAAAYAFRALAAGAVAVLLGRAIQWPQDNEEGKKDKVLVGYEPDGTAIYMNLPFGKYAGELTEWQSEPLTYANRIMFGPTRLALAYLGPDGGNLGYGRQAYTPHDARLSVQANNWFKAAGLVTQSVFPVGTISAIVNSSSAPTETDRKYAQAQLIGQMSGFTISHGAPGGPAVGDLLRVSERLRGEQAEQMPDIRRQIKTGDTAGAMRRMIALGMAPGLARWEVKVTLNPKARISKAALQRLTRGGTPEEQAQFERDQATAP